MRSGALSSESGFETSKLQRKSVVTTRLLLIRHAEVEVRYQRLFGGRLGVNISPNGRARAGALADSLRHRPLDAIYSSAHIEPLNFTPWRYQLLPTA